MAAEQLCACRTHGKFGLAVGTLIQHLVQTLRTERLFDQDSVVLLVAVVVILHCLADGSVDLIAPSGEIVFSLPKPFMKDANLDKN